MIKNTYTLPKAAEEKYHHLFIHANDMIYLLNLKGVLLDANPATKKITGYSPKELIGKDILTLGCIPKSYHAQIKKQRQFRLSGDKNATKAIYEFEWVHKNGKRIVLETNAAPIYKDKHIVGLQCIARDMTERKQQEQRMITTNKDLELVVKERTKKIKKLNMALEKGIRERTKNLRVSNEQLKKLLKDKANFLKQTTEQLTLPLMVMQKNAELLLSKDPSQEQAKIIYKESDKLQKILADFSYLAIDDATKHKTLDVQTIDWEEIFVHVMHELGACALAKKIYIDREFNTPGQTYHGNPAYLSKLMFHLLNNAVKFSDAGGKVSVRITGVKNGLNLLVEDRGIGIAEIHKKRIFDSFYKIHLLQEQEREGTGIGLTICKSIADLHKGKITVSSAINEGTKVNVFLPFNNI